jgi:outer membrane lipoprotein SlyB
MLPVIWALVVGVVVGMLASRGRAFARTVLLALVGSYAGTLVGGVAGEALAAATGMAPLVEIGLAAGAVAGAAVGPPLSDRLGLDART